MKVSILMPIYNVEKYIERCVRSLFEQTYTDVEYIFVDDCSPDNSIEIIKKILDEYPLRKEHVRIIRHERNRGLAAARNTAVENCQTGFLIHVDSDDYLEKDAVEKLVNKQQEDDYDIVTGNANIIYPDKKSILRKNEPEEKRLLILEYIKPTLSHVIWGRLIRTSLYSNNKITAIEGYNIGEDHLVVPQLFYFANKVSSIDDAIYNYDHTNPNSYLRQSISTEKYNEKIRQDIKALEGLCHFFENCPEEEYKSQAYQEMCKYTYSIAPYFVSSKQPHSFRSVWKIFFSVPKEYRYNLPGKSDSLSLAIKSHYITATLLYVVKIIFK